MDPDVVLALGLEALAESQQSYPEEWDERSPGSWARGARMDAKSLAENLFDWICNGGYYPKDRRGCGQLLMEFGFDPTPTVMVTLDTPGNI